MENSIREIEINGCVEVPDNISLDEFNDKFLEFIEDNGLYFGGGINWYEDDAQ